MEQFREKLPGEPRPEQSLWNVPVAGAGLAPPADLHFRPQNVHLWALLGFVQGLSSPHWSWTKMGRLESLSVLETGFVGLEGFI